MTPHKILSQTDKVDFSLVYTKIGTSREAIFVVIGGTAG